MYWYSALMRRIWLASTIMAAILPSTAVAQDRVLQQCAAAVTIRAYCNSIVHAMEIVQPRIGLAAAGGNPVPGASSTLGMKLGAVPRISIGGRFTTVTYEIPAIDTPGSTNDIDARSNAFQFDASVGIYSGLSLLPTVGGFASLDLVGTFGRVSMPDDHGFTDDVTNWGIGARLGLLRESFTAPGVSVTGMYRGLGEMRYDDPGNPDDVSFELSGTRVLSLRGVVGKRLLAVGAMAGVGYDRVTSDARFDIRTTVPPITSFTEDGFKSSRTNLFGSVQWTLLILSAVAEAGWQLGGDAFTAPLPAGHESGTDRKSFFASIALRLSI